MVVKRISELKKHRVPGVVTALTEYRQRRQRNRVFGPIREWKPEICGLIIIVLVLVAAKLWWP